jgi:hypothetical protein
MTLTEQQIAELARGCDGTENCDCPTIRYENEDGACYHKACEGLQEDCGDDIRVVAA